MAEERGGELAGSSALDLRAGFAVCRCQSPAWRTRWQSRFRGPGLSASASVTTTVTDLTFGWFWNCQGKVFCLLVLLRGQDGLKLEICRSGNSWEEFWSPQAGITRWTQLHLAETEQKELSTRGAACGLAPWPAVLDHSENGSASSTGVSPVGLSGGWRSPVPGAVHSCSR